MIKGKKACLEEGGIEDHVSLILKESNGGSEDAWEGGQRPLHRVGTGSAGHSCDLHLHRPGAAPSLLLLPTRRRRRSIRTISSSSLQIKQSHILQLVPIFAMPPRREARQLHALHSSSFTSQFLLIPSPSLPLYAAPELPTREEAEDREQRGAMEPTNRRRGRREVASGVRGLALLPPQLPLFLFCPRVWWDLLSQIPSPLIRIYLFYPPSVPVVPTLVHVPLSRSTLVGRLFLFHNPQF